MEHSVSYKKGFIPYALAALLVGLVGGFSTVLGPAFVQDIGIAYSNTTWTALAQAMSTAACAPILGKIGDVIGRRKTLLLGILVFTLGNVLSALAGSLAFMLAARFIVGVGSAAIAPVILAYIATEFPQDKIAKGFSLYMLLSSASVIIGPTIGALIVSSYGWRAMLWVCVAVCAGIFAICALTSRAQDSTRTALKNFDVAGSVFVLIFFSLLLCVPSFGQNFGWGSLPFLTVLALAIVSLVGLVLAERKSPHPILSGSFIKRWAFILSILALFLTQGLLQANMTNTIVFVNYTQPDNTAVSGYAISVMYVGGSARTETGADRLSSADRDRMRDVAAVYGGHLRPAADGLPWRSWFRSGRKRNYLFKSRPVRSDATGSGCRHRDLWPVPGSGGSLRRSGVCPLIYQPDHGKHLRRNGRSLRGGFVHSFSGNRGDPLRGIGHRRGCLPPKKKQLISLRPWAQIRYTPVPRPFFMGQSWNLPPHFRPLTRPF